MAERIVVSEEMIALANHVIDSFENGRVVQANALPLAREILRLHAALSAGGSWYERASPYKQINPFDRASGWTGPGSSSREHEHTEAAGLEAAAGRTEKSEVTSQTPVPAAPAAASEGEDDITSRLRYQTRYVYGLVRVTMAEAANEIIALRADRDRLQRELDARVGWPVEPSDAVLAEAWALKGLTPAYAAELYKAMRSAHVAAAAKKEGE